MPKSLEVDGINPLKSLHSALSKNLHKGTEDECLEQAVIIKKILIYLVNQIKRDKESKKEFSESLKKLLS